MNSDKIHIGDKFYFDSYATHKKLALPDYLKVTEIKKGFLTAEYENRFIGPKERLFSLQNLYVNSNLNPMNREPDFIFLKGAGHAV